MAERPPLLTLSRLHVRGFKSLRDVSVEVRPLTVFAGANSSGKSSLMQPLLLLKQTMEARFESEGDLLLDGPNVRFTDPSQLLTRISTGSQETFDVGAELIGGLSTRLRYRADDRFGFRLDSVRLINARSLEEVELTAGLAWDELPDIVRKRIVLHVNILPPHKYAGVTFSTGGISLQVKDQEGRSYAGMLLDPTVGHIATELFHLPGLRGLPERAYPSASRFGDYRGTFEQYTASIISGWQDEKSEQLNDLADALYRLKLTGMIKAHSRSATEIELLVGRLPAASLGEDDFVNVADVGVGVSQALPVVVALLEAKEGQVVYIEQPELHLHPNAQRAMAELLVEAAARGVRVVIETHSSLLLLAIRTLVASNALPPDDVALHWFERDAEGYTKVTRAHLDANGAFGDWPADFADIELDAHGAYIDAVAAKQRG